jgi:hypothetical protein
MTDLPFDPLTALVTDMVPVTIGRATIAWNNVSYAVFSLFHLLSGLDDEAAKATFFCVASDRSQRDMVISLVDTKLKSVAPDLAKKAKAQIGSVNALAGRRNDILHVIFIDDHKPSAVRPFNPRGHIKTQQGHELLNTIHNLTIECLEISIAILGIASEAQKRMRVRNAIVEALLQKTAGQGAGVLASQGEFGVLNVSASEPSPPEDGDSG